MTIEESKIAALCDAVGYGRVMHEASRLWRTLSVADGHPGGEFVVGPCAAETAPCPHPETPPPGIASRCDWCCGSGWVTKRVLAVMGAVYSP